VADTVLRNVREEGLLDHQLIAGGGKFGP